jgi:hypothetical protein
MKNIFLAGIYLLEQIQKAFGTRLASRILSPILSSHWLIMKKIHGWGITNFFLATKGFQPSPEVFGYKQNLNSNFAGYSKLKREIKMFKVYL